MVKNNKKVPLIYQGIADEIEFNTIPKEWQKTNLNTFSKEITLFDYQQDALKNALKLLHYYFNSLQKYDEKDDELLNIERKKKFFNEIWRIERELIDTLGIINKKNKPLFNKLKQYYPVIKERVHEKIHFLNFINRMSFWMATGSGKTIVLLKLIELLDNLKQSDLIPGNDILILTHREDLICQIKKHIEEFNKTAERKIKAWDLKKYDDVKCGNVLVFKENINVFIYRSDLISDQTKEKLLNFEDIENKGKWYVLLDEAHKGDKEDSKRQLYYSALTRNGFLFNFSATFTDAWDIISTGYNFNLESFIDSGYGKNVYLSQQELNAFKDKTDFNDRNKQKIVLKSLILLTIIKKVKNNINKKLGKKSHYHNPLLISLVNSVNIRDSDLEIFFNQIEKIASGDIEQEIFEYAKKELSLEFTEHPRYVFGHDELKINKEQISEIDVTDILKNIFNSSSSGKIEVIKIPQNREELIFKLKTSDQPFALIKIGDISKWLKEKLTNYEINESYNNKSFFKAISEADNSVNLLMGSRAFYEGWDSNRPNVMVFVNIGIGDAKKYVTQSIGRGVRIEPIKGERKRLMPLARENNSLAKEMRLKLEPGEISLIESLFVFGTNKDNVLKILEGIKYERKTSGELIKLKENENRKNYNLLIPVYKDRKTADIKELPKFEGNKKLLENFFDWLGDERLIYGIFPGEKINPKTIAKLKEFIDKGKFEENGSGNVSMQTRSLINHLNVILKEIDKFKELEDEIVHFKKIRVTLPDDELKKLKESIEQVTKYRDPADEKTKLKELVLSNKITLDEYTTKIEKLAVIPNEKEFKELKIKHILNHYYIPLILSTKDKINYINHIIKVESERKFIEKLESHLKQENNFFNRFDWWMFCKLDEHLDNIYVPYYNRPHNEMAKFKPDFIFWLKKGCEYFIIFIDPKGTSHTDYELKVDGYKEIFEENSREKEFRVDDNKVRVYLQLHTKDKNILPEGYRKYWFNEFSDLIKI